MPFTVVYHLDVKSQDIPAQNRNINNRIQPAIEFRPVTEPERYGEPLRRTLKGCWKLRLVDDRVVFKVVKTEVWIFAIINQRQVYHRIEKRISIL